MNFNIFNQKKLSNEVMIIIVITARNYSLKPKRRTFVNTIELATFAKVFLKFNWEEE